MNLAFIEAFLVTARVGSMMKASETLRISHAALSKQLGSLETYYGVRFFDRSPKGVALTAAGRLYYERIEPVYAELKAIEAELRASAGDRKVGIGALPSIAAYVLPDVVRALEGDGYEVRLTVRETSDELSELLRRGELQAALLELRPIDAGDFWSAELFSEPYDVVVPDGHRFSGRGAVSMAEIGEEPLILHPPTCTTRRLVSALIEEAGGRVHVKAEVPFGDFLLGYAATGAGVTFAPRLASERLAIPGLTAVPIDHPRAKRTISLASGSRRIGSRLLPFFRRD
jgi:DNA-binding transcriptional LysR family regulator